MASKWSLLKAGRAAGFGAPASLAPGLRLRGGPAHASRAGLVPSSALHSAAGLPPPVRCLLAPHSTSLRRCLSSSSAGGDDGERGTWRAGRRRNRAGASATAKSGEEQGQGEADHEFVLSGEDWEGGSSGFDDVDALYEEEPLEPARERRNVPAEVRCFDTAKICAQSGRGGDGIVSFRREKYVPRGGPDGGNGGRGGHVWVVATKGLNSLSSFRNQIHFRAKKGANGMGRDKAGAAGKDIEVQVPIGTIIRRASDFADDDGATVFTAGGEAPGAEGEALTFDESFAGSNELTSELDELGQLELLREGERKLLVHGGRGGRGNASFRTSTIKAPRLSETGEAGLEEWFELELKLVADVGIVGAPNAGKSTLLAALSNAKPKIAAYPFTTLVPNLGVCDKLGYKSIVFADVPGLLEGAHTGIGLGQEFLRHCERCKVLVQVIDGDSPDPLGDFHAIRTELELFSESLSTKPFIVAINKIDIPEVLEKTKDLQAYLAETGIEVHSISAVARQGVDPLVQSVDSVLTRFEESERQQEFGGFGGGGEGGVDYGGFIADGFQSPPQAQDEAREEHKRLRRAADKATTKRDFSDFKLVFEGATRTWVVKGRAFESFVQMTNWDYYQAWQRFRKIIKVSGLGAALKSRGVRNGDTVVIGSQEFEWNSKMDKDDLSYAEWKDFADKNNTSS